MGAVSFKMVRTGVVVMKTFDGHAVLKKMQGQFSAKTAASHVLFSDMKVTG